MSGPVFSPAFSIRNTPTSWGGGGFWSFEEWNNMRLREIKYLGSEPRSWEYDKTHNPKEDAAAKE